MKNSSIEGIKKLVLWEGFGAAAFPWRSKEPSSKDSLGKLGSKTELKPKNFKQEYLPLFSIKFLQSANTTNRKKWAAASQSTCLLSCLSDNSFVNIWLNLFLPYKLHFFSIFCVYVDYFFFFFFFVILWVNECQEERKENLNNICVFIFT